MMSDKSRRRKSVKAVSLGVEVGDRDLSEIIKTNQSINSILHSMEAEAMIQHFVSYLSCVERTFRP
jgi:hypothetical protein